MCPQCRRPLADCGCRDAARAQAPAGNGAVRVGRERRAGKTVTVVRGLPLAAPELVALGKRLRSACSAGGTAKDGVVEVQGDHVDFALDWLRQAGWPGKRTGA